MFEKSAQLVFFMQERIFVPSKDDKWFTASPNSCVLINKFVSGVGRKRTRLLPCHHSSNLGTGKKRREKKSKDKK